MASPIPGLGPSKFSWARWDEAEGFVYNLFFVRLSILATASLHIYRHKHSSAQTSPSSVPLLPFTRICDQESANPFQYLYLLLKQA